MVGSEANTDVSLVVDARVLVSAVDCAEEFLRES